VHDVATDGQCGTDGCTAPEGKRNDLGAYTSKTDVWAVGCCIGSLMWKDEGIDMYHIPTPKEDPEFVHDEEQRMTHHWEKMVYGEGWQPDMNDFEVGPYSQDLRRLVEDCMQFKPEDRLTFPQLLERVQQLR